MLKKSRKLKAHQGTIVYNEPDTGPVEAPQVNRDIGITRPRNITVPTEQPVTDTAPAPTPIAPAPTPATPLPATPDVTGTVEPTIDEITVDDDPIVAAEPTQTMPKPIQAMPDPFQLRYGGKTRPELSFPQPLPREFRKIPTPQPFMPMPRTQPYRPRGIRPYDPFPSPSRNPFMRRPMPYNPYGQFSRRQLLGRGMDRRLSDLINNANRRASRGGLKPNTMPGYLNEMMQNLIRNNNTYRPRGFGNSIGRSMGYNEGGAVMEDQMEMNFGDTPVAQLAEGGMKDDGGKKDPVSGNDVPIGSLDQEVRDDVPAMVSEGEFIFPADVTRYIGLDKLMQLRQDAKMGLKKMEMMGQLGNPEDAVLPDDIPFDAADIIIVDDEMEEEEESAEEKYQGGVTGFQKGTADPSQSYYNITEEANKPYNKKYVVYQNDEGKTVLVLSTFNGDPLESVPAGYKIVLNPDGSPATQIPERKDKEDDDKDKDEDTSVQQYGDDDDKDEKLAAILATADKAAKTTADRLGMEVKDYLALPMKTRFNLIGEELKVMRGGELDITKRDAIIDGAAGDNIFGGGLLGGMIDTIGSIFDKDNDGSMWTSTDKDGNVRNIFGQIIQTGVDVSKMGILKDGRWTKAATVKKPKGSGVGNLSQNLTTSPYDTERGKKRYERDDTYGAADSIMRTSNDPSRPGGGRGTTSAVRKAQSDKTQAGLAGPGFASGKFKQDKGDGTDTPSTVSGSSYTDTSSISGIEKAENKTTSKQKEADDFTAKQIEKFKSGEKVSGFKKGGLANKPEKRITKKKQPTKRKTLLKKRS